MTLSALPSMRPPLTVRWSIPRAIWPIHPASVYPESVFTQTADPYALVRLEPETGREVWRVPGEFWLARQGQCLIGMRGLKKRGREERCDAIVLDIGDGRVKAEAPALYRPQLFVTGAEWYVGGRLPDESTIARVPLASQTRGGWEAPLSPRPTEFAFYAGAVEAVVLVVGDEIVALSAESGERIWTATLEGIDTPAQLLKWQLQTCGDIVLASTDGGTVAFDAASGEKVWYCRVRGTLAACEDRVYVTGYNPRAPYPGHTLWVLDLRSGKVLLERYVSDFLERVREGNRFASYAVVSDTHIFIADDIGTLWALEKTTAEPVWSHRPKGILGYIHGTRPVLTAGRLYVTSFSMDRKRPPHLYCYEEATTAESIGLGERAAGATVGAVDFRIVETRKRRELIRRAPCHADGGQWTVYACRTADATFYMAVLAEKSKRTGPLSSAVGALWVATVADGDRLLSELRRALGSRMAAGKGSRPKSPTILGVVLLGSGVGEGGSGAGSWVHSKWSGSDGAPEFYVRWSEKDGRGQIREKDDVFRRSLVNLFAALVRRS